MAENVKAHGAAGDGVADDGVVWNNARASLPAGGGVVLVPPGSYALTTAFTFGGQSNVLVWISAGVTLSGLALPAPTGTNMYLDLRSGKITLGDVNLYRSAADQLASDDSLRITGGPSEEMRVGPGALGSVGAFARIGPIGDTNNVYMMGDGSGANVGCVLRAKGIGVVQLEGAAGTKILVRFDANGDVRLDDTNTSSKVLFGTTLDTNLYREGANILATDDKLHVVGEAEIDGALNHDGTTVGFYGTVPATQRPANPDTSGATLAALETEVNELKQVLRDYGLLAT